MPELFIFSMLLIVGLYFGNRAEQQHMQSLKRREQAVQHLGISVAGGKAEFPQAQEAQLFAGSVVISSDFFKTFIAGLLNLIGGEISTYESLLDRARREAMVRMEESALAWGANQVVNVRIQTAELSANSGKGIVAVEVIAYGTGLR
ncbi:MAG: heavy metal-binding domain-containing protein [Leptolyngbya sp.]|nr:heavy metal-binding domain-containing protein [Leptolyngbya sp.]